MTNEEAPIHVLCVVGEQRAASQLGEVGISAWAPSYKKLRFGKKGRADYLVEVPLIPGYVFARLTEADIAKAMATERVYGRLTYGDGAPAILPEAEWVKLLLLSMSGKLDERVPATKARPRGERRRGLKGLEAWFDAVRNSQLQAAENHAKGTGGGESVSEDASPSRRSTGFTRLRAA